MKVPYWKLDIATDEVKIVLDALKCHHEALTDCYEDEPAADIKTDVDLLAGVIERMELRIVPLVIVEQVTRRKQTG